MAERITKDVERSLTEDEKVEEEILEEKEKTDIESQLTPEERVEDEVVREIDKKLHPKKKELHPIIYDTKDEESEEIDLKEIKDKTVKFIKNLWQGVKETKTAESEEEQDMLEKRQQLVKFVKEKWNYILYVILAGIIWFGWHIRTRNIWLLTDITTNKYVPLALDPHHFLRYARYIVEHGALPAVDYMKYFPYGYHYPHLYDGMAQFIVKIYQVMNFFNSSVTIEYADVMYPVIAFAISCIFFFLLIRKLFNYKVALLATLFLTVSPAYLYRTMAGFSDHEAAGMMFWFMAFYFFARAWGSKDIKKAIMWGVVSGLATSGMGMVWLGGTTFVFLIIGGFTILEILFNKFSKQDFYIYISWFFTVVFCLVILTRYMVFKQLITSTTSGIMTLAFAIGIVEFIVFKLNIFKIKDKLEKFAPSGIMSFVLASILGLLALSVLYGPQFIYDKIKQLYIDLITPFGQSRWALTVAESHQPYLVDWVSQLGLGEWAYILLFFGGAIWLFNEMLKPLGKGKWTLTAGFGIFLWALTFSRYDRSSVLNGVNTLSKTLYIGSLIGFFAILIGSYLYTYYKKREIFKLLTEIKKRYILLFVWAILLIIAARGAIRLVFVLTPITTILASYMVFELFSISSRLKDKLFRYSAIAVIIILLFNPFAIAFEGMIIKFSKASLGSAKYTGPSYNRQWQIAGKWIRENTPIDAVFGHWWDYGYWVQTGGERATVTDGSNAIGLWNYYMGRHALIGQDQTEALQYLYAHNVTHFLIISDEIGKYTAYSSIGGGVNYERYSWITTFALQPKQTQETREGITYFYQGGHALDEDFDYNGKQYPGQAAGIGGVLLPIKKEKIEVNNQTQTVERLDQPEVIMVYQGQQEKIPLKCVYVNNQMYLFDKPGYEGCFRIMPTISGGKLENPIGAGLLVSRRGVNAIWTQLFLFNQKNPNFDTSAYKLVYSDEEAGMPLALYDGRQIGPLKIWEIEYPKEIKFDSKYILLSYAQANLTEVTKI